MRDIQHVIQPAEERYLAIQPELEKAAAAISARSGVAAAGAFVAQYTNNCMKQVAYAYHELVDYLMFQYLLGDAEVAPPALPEIAAPAIPGEPVHTSR